MLVVTKPPGRLTRPGGRETGLVGPVFVPTITDSDPQLTVNVPSELLVTVMLTVVLHDRLMAKTELGLLGIRSV